MLRQVAIGVLLLQSAACAANAATSAIGSSSRPPDHEDYAHPFVQITSRGDHTCGLRRNGTLHCWGQDRREQVSGPNGDTGSDFVQVSAGYEHTCALRKDGSAICWGLPQDGPSSASTDYTQIAAGYQHTCALHRDRSITCWARPGSTTRPRPHPGPPAHGVEVEGPNADTSKDYAQLALDDDTCALRVDGTVTCWGRVVPPDLTNVVHITVGRLNTCVLRSEGGAYCWGHYAEPTDVNDVPGSGFTQLSAGTGHTCGVRSDGSITCFGGAYQPAGHVDGPSADGGHDFLQTSAGTEESCGLRRDGTVTCWSADGSVSHHR